MSWLRKLLGEIDAVDLSKPCPNIKALNEIDGDVILGELDEYLQRLHRVVEKRRDTALETYQKMEDLHEVHLQEHRKKPVGECTSCDQHVAATKELMKQMAPLLLEYANLHHLFNIELEQTYSEKMGEHEVTGVRNGKILIGRRDNKRGDQDILDKIIASGGDNGISLGIHIVAVKAEPSEETPTPQETAGAGAN